MKHKKDVIKASPAIHIENNINLLQRRAFNVLLANAYDELPVEEVHSIKVTELTEVLGFESRNDKHLKESLKALMTCLVEWNLLGKDKTQEWGATTLLASVEIKNGICTYAYSPPLRKRLHNPKMYARISLSLQNQFDSKHALALYELCVDYLHFDRNYGETSFIPLDNFRKLMGLGDDKYPEFKDLRRYVLKPAITEINAKTDLQVSVESRRKSRKVAAVKFVIHRVMKIPKGTTQPQSPADEKETPDIVVTLIRLGVSRQEAMKLRDLGFASVNTAVRPLDGDWETYLREKLAMLEAQPQGRIENRAGWLLQAIKENWTDEKLLKQQQAKARAENKHKITMLQRRKEELQQQYEQQCETIFRQIVQKTPEVVAETLNLVLEQQPELKQGVFYDSTKTPLENYQRAFIQIPVNKKLREKYPKRFAELDSKYQRTFQELDEQIAKLRA